MGNYHVIPQLFNKIKNKLKKSKKNFIDLNIQGNGSEVRSFMHIDDFVNAFDLVFFSKVNNGIFNIGNNDPVTISGLVKKISRLVNKKINVTKTKIKKGSPNKRLPDITKITKLGYVQKISLEEGLRTFI